MRLRRRCPVRQRPSFQGIGFGVQFGKKNRVHILHIGVDRNVIFGEIVVHVAAEARIEDHRFFEGRADAKDHPDRLRSRGLLVQDTAGGKDAQHVSQPDLAGIDIDANLGKVRAIGLLREVCARGARSDLAVGVDVKDPDSRTARRVIRMPRCPFSSMTAAFVPGGDPSSPAIVKRLTGGHVPGV
jgi:hypothetical protein